MNTIFITKKRGTKENHIALVGKHNLQQEKKNISLDYFIFSTNHKL